MILLAPPLSAQDLTFDTIHTTACLVEATEYGQRLNCIGASANQCMETSEGGYSTYGMSGCLSEEYAYWDQRLNIAYKALKEITKARDLDKFETAPSQSEALLDMQRAWIPFRDAKCDFERSEWGGGTGGGPATYSCLMYETAKQALYLEASADTP